MKSNNDRAAPPRAQSRSRVDQGAEAPPMVLYPGVRRYGRLSGFLFSDTAPTLISLEMSPERVRANLSAALALTKR